MSEAYKATDFAGTCLQMESRVWREGGSWESSDFASAAVFLLCQSHARRAATAHILMAVSSHWATSIDKLK